MPTVREYFDRMPAASLAWDDDNRFPDGKNIRSRQAIIYDSEGGTKHLRIYVPKTAHPDAVVAGQLSLLDSHWANEHKFEFHTTSAGFEDAEDMTAYVFTGRIIVYSETNISDDRWNALATQMKIHEMTLRVRDRNWADTKMKYETPLAFLSHDSRDKEAFVRPLAQKLSSMLFPVWYDEYSLTPGQSLRASIQKGLKECPKCIVVLSKNFFANKGWTAKEFNSVYQREILEGQNVMIPIWLGVTKEEVYDYSPDLLDNVGIDAGKGIEAVARAVAGVLGWTVPSMLERGGTMVKPGENAHLGSFDKNGARINDG